MPTHKIGFVLTGKFENLSAHVGSLYRYKEEEDRGNIGRPGFAIGSSAGAIVTSSCFSPWHHKNIETVGNIVRQLTGDQIFDYHFWMESAGILTVVEDIILPFLPEGSTKTKRIVVKTGKSILSLGTKALLTYELLEKPSLFSNKPLYNLLKDNLKPEYFWKSGEDGPNKIKIEIPSTDLVTAEEWFFTNYLPEHRNLENRDEWLIRSILASASIPAHFPTQKIGDMVLDDAALKINAPLHRAVAAGCDTIFIFLQTPFHEKVSPPETWIEELSRALDIAISESTRKTVEGHQETNQDLEVAENLRRIVAKKNDPALNTEHEEEMKKFPFYNRKKTMLIPIVADEKLPHIFVGKFKREDMERGMEIGYRAMGKALELFYEKTKG